MKRLGGPFARALARPFAVLGRFFIRTIGIPIYRFVFWVRRWMGRLILPTRRRLLFFLTNRYVIHFVVALIVGFVISMNMQNREVRAESFGQESLLYSFISATDVSAVEVVTVTEEALRTPRPVSYLDDPSLSPEADIDLDFLDSGYVTTIVGGSAVATPTIRENAASVAARAAVESYTVEEGDTLGTIAEKFGLNLSTILWANKLTFRSIIRPGQGLVIPPVDGVIYQVKRGDTIGKIAKTYGVDQEKIIAFNRLEDPNALTVGSQIIIPDGEPPAPPPAPASVSRVFARGSAEPRGSATGSGTWVWPTDWRVITQYFRGWRHTGIDIDGDYTTRSYAATDGVVVFAGWKGGYGLAVEIDHGNGLVTRYGHHSKNFVAKGDVVTAGQAIAQTGTTGRSTGTHLHFEVIKNGKFLNPLDYVR